MGLKFQREDNLDKMLEDFAVLPAGKISETPKKDDDALAKAMAAFDAKEKAKEEGKKKETK